jgi:glutathione synthase/RimK-type ligase-like ATP-grasp enzyme
MVELTTTPTARVALVTCREVPELDADTHHLLAPLAARSVQATAVVWDDPRVDWAVFDLAVVRSCWDYAHRRGDFLAWAQRVPRLANPAATIAWNTDKRYLRELERSGVPMVPTTWVRPGERWAAPADGDWVVKPAVSLAGLDSGRYRLEDADERRLAIGHVHRLQRPGRMVMVQPYLPAGGLDLHLRQPTAGQLALAARGATQRRIAGLTR